MARSLPPGFKLSEASLSDSDAIWQLCEIAFRGDEIWLAGFSACDFEDVHRWNMEVFPARWNLPDITIYKITEESTGRIVAWTALEFPWNIRPLKEDQLAIVNSHGSPPSIEGINMQGFVAFIECLSFAGQYGYEPKTDYHRKGTMIHPDFQKRGFGTILTQHCNAISDKTGGKTWVSARPSSNKMFRMCGFKEVGSNNARLARFGRSPDTEITYMLLREPPN